MIIQKCVAPLVHYLLIITSMAPWAQLFGLLMDGLSMFGYKMYFDVTYNMQVPVKISVTRKLIEISPNF